MVDYFGYIFWGLLLAFLDFKINGFDLLPDVVGYVLVAVGAFSLGVYSPKFSLGGALSCLQAAGWLVGLAVGGEAGVPFGLLMTALNCGMIWTLLGGMIDFTTAKDRPDLAELAHNRRVLYVAITAGVWLFAAVANGSGGGPTGVIVFAGIIAMFVTFALVLRVIYRVGHEVAKR